MIAALALGSNLSSSWGAPAAAIAEAVRRLGAFGTITAVSSLRLTEPVGYLDQPDFLNGAALIDTALPPLDLIQALLSIERDMGRTRDGIVLKGPRVIDLDLLLYDGSVVSTAELTIPHPRMHQRLFVLEPLAEIAPNLHHPIFNATIADLLARLVDRQQAHSSTTILV